MESSRMTASLKVSFNDHEEQNFSKGEALSYALNDPLCVRLYKNSLRLKAMQDSFEFSFSIIHYFQSTFLILR